VDVHLIAATRGEDSGDTRQQSTLPILIDSRIIRDGTKGTRKGAIDGDVGIFTSQLEIS
jgi:hypothetical protein